MEEYCGQYEELADQLIENYGGDDELLNYSEFEEVLDSFEGVDLTKEVTRLLFNEVANNDGGISKEDFVQYANEITQSYIRKIYP